MAVAQIASAEAGQTDQGTSQVTLVWRRFRKQKLADYTDAARALGVSNWKIILRHMLPNALAPISVASTFGCGDALRDALDPRLKK